LGTASSGKARFGVPFPNSRLAHPMKTGLFWNMPTGKSQTFEQRENFLKKLGLLHLQLDNCRTSCYTESINQSGKNLNALHKIMKSGGI